MHYLEAVGFKQRLSCVGPPEIKLGVYSGPAVDRLHDSELPSRRKYENVISPRCLICNLLSIIRRIVARRYQPLFPPAPISA